jgi:hypothetical protein
MAAFDLTIQQRCLTYISKMSDYFFSYPSRGGKLRGAIEIIERNQLDMHEKTQ